MLTLETMGSCPKTTSGVWGNGGILICHEALADSKTAGNFSKVTFGHAGISETIKQTKHYETETLFYHNCFETHLTLPMPFTNHQSWESIRRIILSDFDTESNYCQQQWHLSWRQWLHMSLSHKIIRALINRGLDSMRLNVKVNFGVEKHL